MTRLLTTREVAERLGLAPATVLRKVATGDIAGFRLGTNVLRFDAAEIDAYLEARRTKARPQPEAVEPGPVGPDRNEEE
jgi:excisionase family DNA binding protein